MNSLQSSGPAGSPARLFHALNRLLKALVAITLLCSSVARGSAEERINFAEYDTPLYSQIVDHISEKVSARLGNGPNHRDRYFIIPFAYQNRGNDPEFSHSFMTVIRVLADGKHPTRSDELKTGRFKRWEFEAFNISWIPNDFLENPHLCVFHGLGSRLFPTLNQCPLSDGKNFNLKDTITIAARAKVVVAMWGPYEITKEGFDLGVGRKRLLDSGAIKYRADDRLYRKNRVAINCFHAMAGLEELFPNGGFLGTGFKMWGLNGTTRVLIEYKSRAGERGILLEPVDPKRDRYGFVYVDGKNSRSRIYNPFPSASAYRR